MLAVIYLIFNEGWAEGRVDLSGEAIRLGRSVADLMPDEPEAHALLALMLINHARTAARVQGGELVLLDHQDRSPWDHHQIEESRDLLKRALTLHGSGPYVIQAAIADLHLPRPRDWEEIALLYERLEELTSSPVVTMNRAIAVAELEDPKPGSHCSTGLNSTATATTTPPARTCRGTSAATMKPVPGMHARSN